MKTMREKTEYKTRQQAQIIGYLRSMGNAHVTVSQIVEHFKVQGINIGTTTIYRQLEKLLSKGLLRKSVTDGTGACYQYIGEECSESSLPHFHLKCISCGQLLHMECMEIAKLKSHILSEHGFEIQPRQTTFYGRCSKCRMNPSEDFRRGFSPFPSK